MNQRYDAVTTRIYTDKDGKEKKAYTKIGTAFFNAKVDGYSLQLDALPVPQLYNGKLQCSILLLPPKEKEVAPKQLNPVTGDLDDEIPF